MLADAILSSPVRLSIFDVTHTVDVLIGVFRACVHDCNWIGYGQNQLLPPYISAERPNLILKLCDAYRFMGNSSEPTHCLHRICVKETHLISKSNQNSWLGDDFLWNTDNFFYVLFLFLFSSSVFFFFCAKFSFSCGQKTETRNTQSRTIISVCYYRLNSFNFHASKGTRTFHVHNDVTQIRSCFVERLLPFSHGHFKLWILYYKTSFGIILWFLFSLLAKWNLEKCIRFFNSCFSLSEFKISLENKKNHCSELHSVYLITNFAHSNIADVNKYLD